MVDENKVKLQINLKSWTLDGDGDSDSIHKAMYELIRKKNQDTLIELKGERAKFDAQIQEIEKILKEKT